mmetsp:Transcript_32823/g.49502  ORF Transcript_32823/g.49502 Transcript_32823/m.49502 type:complete len:92 (-) Transcript_32823:640-915(-)
MKFLSSISRLENLDSCLCPLSKFLGEGLREVEARTTVGEDGRLKGEQSSNGLLQLLLSEEDISDATTDDDASSLPQPSVPFVTNALKKVDG